MLLSGQVFQVIKKALLKLNVPFHDICKDCGNSTYAPVGANRFGALFYFDTDTKKYTAVDTTVPTLSSAVVANAFPNRILLTYNKPLNPSIVPALSAYTPSGGKTVTAVSISGNVVTVTVNTAYVNGNTITVGYTSGTNKVQDLSGNIAANLVAQAVTNNVT